MSEDTPFLPGLSEATESRHIGRPNQILGHLAGRQLYMQQH